MFNNSGSKQNNTDNEEHIYEEIDNNQNLKEKYYSKPFNTLNYEDNYYLSPVPLIPPHPPFNHFPQEIKLDAKTPKKYFQNMFLRLIPNTNKSKINSYPLKQALQRIYWDVEDRVRQGGGRDMGVYHNGYVISNMGKACRIYNAIDKFCVNVDLKNEKISIDNFDLTSKSVVGKTIYSASIQELSGGDKLQISQSQLEKVRKLGVEKLIESKKPEITRF